VLQHPVNKENAETSEMNCLDPVLHFRRRMCMKEQCSKSMRMNDGQITNVWHPQVARRSINEIYNCVSVSI